jgi:hypothetical protein
MSGSVSRIAVSWRARGTIALVGFGERSRFKIKMFSLWTVGHAGPFFHMKTIRHALEIVTNMTFTHPCSSSELASSA